MQGTGRPLLSQATDQGLEKVLWLTWQLLGSLLIHCEAWHHVCRRQTGIAKSWNEQNDFFRMDGKWLQSKFHYLVRSYRAST